mmetsp:Transcript_22406/g.36012  ORF Transcript_22406/g.36012 Transcript_22406/m.36012 type:complete len:307 (-) Transcript_22406:74-994(-)
MEVYKHPSYTRYHASRCSVAAFWSLICYLAVLAAPFFLAYASYGFWKKEGTYYEQPIIEYQHKIAMIVECSSGALVFSSIPEFNLMAGFSNVRIPQVQSFLDDPNLDGRPDYFNLTITVPLQGTEEVYGVSVLAFFDVELKDRVKLEMSGLSYVSQTSSLPGSRFSMFGDLKFTQLYPLSLRGSRTDYNADLLSASSILSVEDTHFTNILAKSASRNETIRIENELSYWRPGRENQFTFDMRLRIPKSEIRYIPGPSEVLKFSWMQYLAVGVIVYFVVDWILYFTHSHALLTSFRTVDHKAKEHTF